METGEVGEIGVRMTCSSLESLAAICAGGVSDVFCVTVVTGIDICVRTMRLCVKKTSNHSPPPLGAGIAVNLVMVP